MLPCAHIREHCPVGNCEFPIKTTDRFLFLPNTLQPPNPRLQKNFLCEICSSIGLSDDRTTVCAVFSSAFLAWKCQWGNSSVYEAILKFRIWTSTRPLYDQVYRLRVYATNVPVTIVLAVCLPSVLATSLPTTGVLLIYRLLGYSQCIVYEYARCTWPWIMEFCDFTSSAPP